MAKQFINFDWRAVVLDFENFSSRARSSINRATAESHLSGHNFVGSEQLLLGVLGADKALVQLMGVTLESVRAEVERTIGRGAGYVSARPSFHP
jgi:ATP-dependent Clp protease ATP-binding subunit ClpC